MNLPTDKLYKFAAVSGLVLLAFAGLQILHTFGAEQSAIAHWNASWAPVFERSTFLYNTASQELSCALQEAKARERTGKPTAIDPCKATLAAMTQEEEKSDNLQVDMARLGGERNILSFLHSQFEITLIWGIPAIVVGAGAAGWGLARWYDRAYGRKRAALEGEAISWISILAWTLYGGLLGWFLSIVFHGMDGQTLAAWVQAVGSIGAILVAFLVGQQQSRAALRAVTEQQRERRDSIVAVAGAAAEHARRIGNALEQDGLGHLPIYNVYDKTIVDGMVHALTDAPAHEVGSPAGVIALLALRDQFAFLGVQMEKYLGGPWKDPDLQRAIESCGDNLEYRRTVIEGQEQVLASNVRMRLGQIHRYYSELKAAVERV